MALILDGNGLIQGLDAGGLPSGSVNADSLASTLDLSSKTMTFGNVSASGITFPASISASSNANTLDDYEEGTWTPVLGGQSATSGQTYSYQTGSYVKIGNHVFCSFDVQISAEGTVTGGAVLQGLPFPGTATFQGAGTVGYFSNVGENYVLVKLTTPSSSGTECEFRTLTSASTTSGGITASTFITNNTRIIGGVWYKTS